MINPLSTANIHNDEDFKKVLQRKSLVAIGIFILGALTVATLLLTEVIYETHQHAFFSGFGTALIAAGGALFIKNRRIMNNPELLKATRIKYTDERVLDIRSKSIMVATGFLLVGMYLICFIGGLIYPMYFSLLSKILLALVCLFLMTYRIAFSVYNKKM